MGIWVHHYAVLHVQVGVNLRGNGVFPSLYDVAVSWLGEFEGKWGIAKPV